MLYHGKDNQVAVIELLPFSKLTEAASKWQDLEHNIRNTGLTNSWLWIKTWLDNYGDIVQPTFAFGMQDNQPIGAALITEATHYIRGIPIPSVHLGTAGEPEEEAMRVEYNRLLVSSKNLNAFAVALIHTLLQRFHWSGLNLDGFVPEHTNALIQAGTEAGLHFRVYEKKSPTFDFQKAIKDGYQDVISALGNDTRYGVRRSLRLFDSLFGPCSIEWAETTVQAKDILRELIDLHQKRWEHVGMPGAFQSDRVRRYHEDLIDSLALWPQGSLIVFRVKQGETTIGCLFHFVDECGHVMFYKIGLPLFEDNKLKPGLITHAICMQECSKRLLLQYDFLAGEGLYKMQLSNTQNYLTWATAQRGPRMWLIDKVRSPFQLTRELINNRITRDILQ